MTNEEFRALAPGDIVRNRRRTGEALIVTANYGGRVTAVRTADLTNPIEWEIVRKAEK